MNPPAHTVPADAEGERLVDHVREHLGVVASRTVGPLIAEGAVRVDGGAGRIAEPVHAGAVLTLASDVLDDLRSRQLVTEPSAGALEVVHEDDDLLVVDKPAGQHVHPMGAYREDTLIGAVLWHASARPDDPWTRWRPHLGHRLDRATSGLLVVAKRREVADRFQALLDAGEVRRTYAAVVTGAVAGDAGTVDAPLGRDPQRDYRRAPVAVADGGQAAVTHWRVRDRSPQRTVLDVTLATGRTHQIRVHLASMGHPIVGDSLYAGPDGVAATSIALRAEALTFPHPVTGVVVDLRREGPLPV